MHKELVQYYNFNPETTRRVEDKGFPVTDEGFLELINSLSVNDWYVCEAGGLPTGCT